MVLTSKDGGENHDLSRTGLPQHRLRRLNEITDWMEKHLK